MTTIIGTYLKYFADKHPTMAKQPSDTELLEISIDLPDEDNDTNTVPSREYQDHPTLESPTSQTMATNNPHETDHISQKYVPPSRRTQHRHQQRTLHKLNDKLTQVQEQLSGLKHQYQINRTLTNPTSNQRGKILSHPKMGYEITTTPSRIIFRISNPHYIEWIPMAQHFLLRAPHFYKTEPSWYTPGYGHVQVTQAHEFAKYVVIRGLHVVQMFNAHFFFRPAREYQNIIIEERVFFQQHIKLRLTTSATRKGVTIPKGAVLGTMCIILPMLVQ